MLFLDHQFQGYRFQHKTFCKTPAQLRKYVSTLHAVKRVRPEYIDAIAANVYHPDTVVRLAREYDLAGLPTVTKEILLQDSLFRWLGQSDLREPTKERYGRCFKTLLKRKSNAKAPDLPQLLKLYRKQCAQKEHFRTFNQTRAAVLSYVSNNFDKYSDLWRQCAATKIFTYQATRKPNHIRPDQVHDVDATFTSDKVRLCFWCLITSGLRPSEFFDGKYEVLDNAIYVNREMKTPSSERFIPKVFPYWRPEPPITQNHFWRQMKDLSYTIQDLRNTFIGWMSECVPTERQLYYAGHDSRSDTMTTYYKRGDAQGYLEKDANALKELLVNAQFPSVLEELGAEVIRKPENDWNPSIFPKLDKI